MPITWNDVFSPIATQDDIYYCFRLILGRNPSPQEWTGHSSLSGEPLENVVRSYLSSAEFANRRLLTASTGNLEQAQLPGFTMYASGDDMAVGKHVLGLLEYEPHVTKAFWGALKTWDVRHRHWRQHRVLQHACRIACR